MALKWRGEAPPQYTQEYKTPGQLLDHLQATAAHESPEADTDTVEVERVRNFMLFCLATDYRYSTNVVLSASDSDHSSGMCGLLLDLKTSHAKTDLTHEERMCIAPYLCKYLHAPCKGLGVPVDYLVLVIMRFVKFTSSHGRHKGCCYGLLHTLDIDQLAYKL
jgi:hypothetical protein